MKKFFDDLFIILLVLVLTSHKKVKEISKISWFKRVLWASLLIIPCWYIGDKFYESTTPYADCAPATLQRIFPQYTIKEMRNICKTERDGTYTTNIFNAWNQLSTNKLEIVYCLEDIEYNKTNKLSFYLNKPYLWIGETTEGGHCALVEFTSTNAILSNSQYKPLTTNYYLTYIDYTNFFRMTHFVLISEDIKSTIRFK